VPPNAPVAAAGAPHAIAPAQPPQTTGPADRPRTIEPRRRTSAAVAGLCGALAVAAVTVWTVNRPRPAPPLPNPLKQQVLLWSKAGFAPVLPTVDACVRQARAGYDKGDDDGLEQAWRASRSALILDPGDAQATALWGLALGWMAERRDSEELELAVGATTSALANRLEPHLRAGLEEARALLLLRLGRPESARQAAEKAMAAQPDMPAARTGWAVSLIQMRPEEAVRALEDLTSSGPASPLVVAALGDALLATGEVAAATSVWTAALDRGQATPLFARRLARLYVQIGQIDQAIEVMQRTIGESDPGVEDALVLSRLYSRGQHKGRQAADILQRALQRSDLTPFSRARLSAEKAMLADGFAGSVRETSDNDAWLDRAFEAAPDMPELLYGAALWDEHHEKIDLARESYEASRDLAPERPEVSLRLALLVRDKDPRQAREIAESASHESPDYLPLHLLRAIFLEQAGDRAAAMESVRRALSLDPDSSRGRQVLDAFAETPGAHATLGQALGSLGEKLRHPMYESAAAVAYYYGGDLVHSQQWIQRAMHLDGQDFGARLCRAWLEIRRGAWPKAGADLAVALEQDRQQPVARLYYARFLEQKKRIHEAERIYRDLIEANPMMVAAHAGLARVLFLSGDAVAGGAEAKRALSMRPDDQGALQVLLRPPSPPAARKHRDAHTKGPTP